MVATPVILLDSEEHTPSTALMRSWDLVKGHRWYVFGCLIGLDMLYWTAALLLHSLLNDGNHPIFYSIFYSIFFLLEAILPASMIALAIGILKTVLYINLLVKEEGLTEQDLSCQIDGQGESLVSPTLLMATTYPVEEVDKEHFMQ